MLKLLQHKFKLPIAGTTLSISATSAVTTLLAAYAIWETYWYQKVGLDIVKWHTHFALYAYIWFTGFYLFIKFNRIWNSENAANFFLGFTSITVSLFAAELVLQLLGTNTTYLEKVTGYYNSPYQTQDKGYYHVWHTPKEHWIEKTEYRYWRPNNTLGLPDVEWPLAKKLNEIRILSLGDSFTEGDGAPNDSDYVALLSQKLLATGGNFYLMNGGVLGSDPFFNYIQLKDQLLPYKPDYILQTISSHDITADINLRGGIERFQKNGTLKFNAPPWWEPLYAVSYISRFIFKALGYNELLKKEDLTAAEIEKLNEQTSQLLIQYQTLCSEHGIKLFVVLRPDKYEIIENKYHYDFAPVFKATGVKTIDLMPGYRNYLRKTNTKAEEYFWVIDQHHNSKGYQMMANVIYESLGPVLADSSTTIAASKIEAGLKTKQATNFSQK